MIVYDKTEIKETLELEHIYELLQEWGGDPEYSSFGILSATICHNEPGEGSHKLYFYSNSGLFRCYTECDGYFDIFELVRKVAAIQWGEEYDLNDAVRWIARRFGISGRLEDGDDAEQIEDWKLLANYNRIQEIEFNQNEDIILKKYDLDILTKFNYKVKLDPWLSEGISQEVLDKSLIGFYAGGFQITIPHFDVRHRFIGLRGRTLVQEDAERYGKYRPLRVNGMQYNHPLGMNLYNLNNSLPQIKQIKKAIVFEGEKSVLLYRTYFGMENDISVACCGSSISTYQMQLLLDAGVEEVIIAFDKQFEKIGSKEYIQWENKIKKLSQKYQNKVLISYIWDNKKLLGYKDSPIDCGKENFLQLFKERRVC